MPSNNKPLLTIGLPFFNNENTLANAIKSILLQSYQHWELILVNDGSTDRSVDIALHFTQLDSRITLIGDSVNRGISHRLNRVIDLANGQYIARMDADDMMFPERLEKQVRVLVADRSIDVIDTASFVIDQADQPVGVRGMWDIQARSKKEVLTRGLLFHPSVVAKTSWYKKNRYNEAYFRAQDYELWCRTFDNTVFSRVYEPLFIYREGKVNVKNYAESARSFRKILRVYRHGVLSLPEYYWEVLKSHVKTSLYHTFEVFDYHNNLSARRNEKLNAIQAKKLADVIHRIKSHTINPVVPALKREVA